MLKKIHVLNETSFLMDSIFSAIIGSTFIVLITIFACSKESNENIAFEEARLEYENARSDNSLKEIAFPEQDPGAPLYARVTPITNQFFVSGETLVIPFFRNPDCIDSDFNLLDFFHVPNAFGCSLVCNGTYLIEAQDPPDIFPAMAHTISTHLPIWFVSWSDFQAATQDGKITIEELKALNPEKGIATLYEEYLKPRFNNHQIVIKAEGNVLPGNKPFQLNLHHQGDKMMYIDLKM